MRTISAKRLSPRRRRAIGAMNLLGQRRIRPATSVWNLVNGAELLRATCLRREYLRRKQILSLLLEGQVRRPFAASLQADIRRAGSAENWLHAPLVNAVSALNSAKQARLFAHAASA